MTEINQTTYRVLQYRVKCGLRSQQRSCFFNKASVHFGAIRFVAGSLASLVFSFGKNNIDSTCKEYQDLLFLTS